MITIVPTLRAVLLLVAAAPVALVIAAVAPGAWVVAAALGFVLLALVVVDALLAGTIADAKVDVPPQIEVGARVAIGVTAALSPGRFGRLGAHPLRIAAALSADPRLVSGGRAELTLASDGGEAHGSVAITPQRRGIATIARLWLRWTGPLGLGARQLVRSDPAVVRIVPNIAALRSPTIQAYLRDAQSGTIARRLRGEGTEFEALADYRPGMDRRSIDWKSSARHARLFAKEFETERNSQIVFALDCGRAMCEPLAGMARIDRAVSAALTTAYVALRGGDRVALFGFAARPTLATEFVSGTAAFHRLQTAVATLDYQPQEPNFTLALATLSARLKRRSLVVVFSDFTDPTSAQLMIDSIGRLLSRHLVLFVTLDDVELAGLATAPPDTLQELAEAVTADALLRQRALAVRQLRRLGVDVIEAPYDRIGARLIDAYLAIKRSGAIG